MKKILGRLLIKIMGLLGYSPFASTRIVQAILEDIKQIIQGKIPLKKTIWSWKRGFTGYRTHVFRINEANYRSHMQILLITNYIQSMAHIVNGSMIS